jgi:hypothetical protein
MREVLVDAKLGESRPLIPRGIFYPAAQRAIIQSHRLLLLDPQLVNSARRAEADFDGVGKRWAAESVAGAQDGPKAEAATGAGGLKVAGYPSVTGGGALWTASETTHSRRYSIGSNCARNGRRH